MHDQVGYIDNLQEHLRELEWLVIQGQTHEEVAICKNSEPVLQGPLGSSTLKPVQPVQPASDLGSTPKEKKPPIEESIVDLPADSTHVTLPDLPEEEPMTAQPSMLVNPHEPKQISKAVNLQPPLSIRYQRASSVLPGTSSLKRAMIGSDMRDPGGPPDPSDNEHSSTKPDGSERPPSCTRKSRRSQRHSRYPGDHDSGPSSSSNSSDSESSDFGSDFLAIEPESDHNSDSVATKRTKWAVQRNIRKNPWAI
jgi:hypothetical protein